jgi:hypothetical protein
VAKYVAKTVATEASVTEYLDAIADPERREDCRQLVALMERAVGERAKMWGAGIVGFGSYHYKYASGHEGDSCLLGFASRKGDISVYLPASFEGSEELFSELGRHKRAKACLYLRKLADVKIPVLEEMLKRAAAEVRLRHPSP